MFASVLNTCLLMKLAFLKHSKVAWKKNGSEIYLFKVNNKNPAGIYLFKVDHRNTRTKCGWERGMSILIAATL